METLSLASADRCELKSMWHAPLSGPDSLASADKAWGSTTALLLPNEQGRFREATNTKKMSH